jgi:hypothetical protein
MKSLGGLLLLFGVGSIVLKMIDRQFIIMSWMDSWGESTGWAIKIGMSVVGGGLWLMGQALEQPEEVAT